MKERKQMENVKLPKIGLRIIKTVVAVFLCFVISELRQESIPFYSAISAILCMQPDIANSLKVGLSRTVGTCIGGLFGLGVLILEKAFLPINLIFVQYFIVSICLIPLIYLTVILHQTASTYITCVVFLSITIAHGADVTPHIFAINRMLDTFIGIFVSLGINIIWRAKKERQNSD